MSKSNTKYNVLTDATGTFEVVDTKSKKATAIEIAERLRGLDRVNARVETDKGTVVFEIAAPSGKRVIRNKTAPWTRVDERQPELPKGVKLPKGYELTYLTPRNRVAVTRHPENLDYLVVDLDTGEAFPADNCREAAKVNQAIKAARKAAESELVSA